MTSSEGESTDCGGTDGTTGIGSGEDARRPVSIHFKTPDKPRGPEPPGLKNRRPS